MNTNPQDGLVDAMQELFDIEHQLRITGSEIVVMTGQARD